MSRGQGACDTFAGSGAGEDATPAGLGLRALDEMSDAAAHVILLLSRRDFARNPLAEAEALVGAARESGGGRLRPFSDLPLR